MFALASGGCAGWLYVDSEVCLPVVSEFRSLCFVTKRTGFWRCAVFALPCVRSQLAVFFFTALALRFLYAGRRSAGVAECANYFISCVVATRAGNISIPTYICTRCRFGIVGNFVMPERTHRLCFCSSALATGKGLFARFGASRLLGYSSGIPFMICTSLYIATFRTGFLAVAPVAESVIQLCISRVAVLTFVPVTAGIAEPSVGVIVCGIVSIFCAAVRTNRLFCAGCCAAGVVTGILISTSGAGLLTAAPFAECVIQLCASSITILALMPMTAIIIEELTGVNVCGIVSIFCAAVCANRLFRAGCLAAGVVAGILIVANVADLLAAAPCAEVMTGSIGFNVTAAVLLPMSAAIAFPCA